VNRRERRRQKALAKRLWTTCVHVQNGTAAEIWCRPDRIGVCQECAIKGSRKLGEKEEAELVAKLLPVCPACLGKVLEGKSILVRGRTFLERDRVLGHVHNN
jgi:hypothetical protein